MRRSKASDFDWLGRGQPQQISAHTRVKRPCNKACRNESACPCCRCQQPPLFSCPTCDGRDAYRVCANRLGDVFDAMAAERPVIEIKLIPDLLVDSVGDANGARPGESLKAGGDVDAIAKDVAAVDDHIAKINTDPELETTVGRHGVVDGPRRSLDLDGAV
jgi:hypothetical protein